MFIRILVLFFIWVTPAFSADEGISCMAQILRVQAAAETTFRTRPSDNEFQGVTLPDAWHKTNPGSRDVVWYRIDWQMPCQPPDGVALLLPSIVLAGEVYVNNHFLWQDKSLVEPLSRSWNMPRYWSLPESWLNKEQPNILWVRVAGINGQSIGLGPVHIGDASTIYQRYQDINWSNRTLFAISLVVSIIIGTFFFFIWIVRRDQTTYGWYALSSFFWVLFAANILTTSPWPFTNSLDLARINAIALVLNISCFCIFTWRFANKTFPVFEKALWTLTIGLVFLLALSPEPYLGVAQLVGILTAMAVFFVNCATFPVYALRTRDMDLILLGICLLSMLFAGVHDLLLLMGIIDMKVAILPYANIILVLCMAGIFGLRHSRHMRKIERFNQELELAIAQTRKDLSDTLEKEFVLKLEGSRLQERLSIGHDLHDGLGGVLVHMIASVEQGRPTLGRNNVLSMLRLIRNDLRQTIDTNASPSMQLPDTPAEWLAVLRHRFGTLFDELDIDSRWLFPDKWSTPPSTLQCLAMTRLIEEALTNVIKHSHAKNVLVRLQLTDAHLTLSIEDDGIGFDTVAVDKAGICIGTRSMTMRIARVGGTLRINSRPGCTLVIAEIPLT